MSFFQTVKLAEYKSGSVRSPVARRREKLAFKVDEQIKLAIDSTFRPTKIVWSRSADGTEHKVEQPKRIKRWWVEAADGTVQLTVRYGAKPLELAKGKNAIALNSVNEVEGTLRKLQLAVLGGELDAILEQQIGLSKPIAK
jgi:hypothetical protein